MGSRSLEVVPTSERRIVALVLPELLVELVTEGEVSRAGETEGRPGARRKGTAR
jgi:hypothetical protein